MKEYIFEGIVSLRAIIERCQSRDQSCRRILRVCISRTRCEKQPKELAWLSHRADELGFSLECISDADIDALAEGNTHGGVVAVCGEREYPYLEALSPEKDGFYMMLEGIEDPYNFGYAVRTLYAAGVDGIVLSPRNWMEAAGTVARSSAGASELIDIYVSDGVAAAELFKANGYRVVCADLRDSVSVYDAELDGGIFLCVGGEKRGLSRSLLERADMRVRLDYARDFGASLSAASAASVLAYEVFRRRIAR